MRTQREMGEQTDCNTTELEEGGAECTKTSQRPEILSDSLACCF